MFDSQSHELVSNFLINHFERIQSATDNIVQTHVKFQGVELAILGPHELR